MDVSPTIDDLNSGNLVNSKYSFPYLDLDRISPDRSVMKLVPQDIAYRYHALPIAKDGNRITVAMASPGDTTASKAVMSVIDGSICFIQADSEEIDQMLDELWPHPPIRKFISILSAPTDSESFWPYTRSFAEALEADFNQIVISPEGIGTLEELGYFIQNAIPDLLVFQAYHASRLMELFSDDEVLQYLEQVPALLNLPPDFRFSIHKILLVLPDNRVGGELAINWAVKIARSFQCELTVLPIFPAVPPCYGSLINHSLDLLLEGNHPLGMKMRSVGDQISGQNIKGSYKLREGDPIIQLRDEILDSDPDLIIIPSVPRRRPAQWLSVDLVDQLINDITKPILITK